MKRALARCAAFYGAAFLTAAFVRDGGDHLVAGLGGFLIWLGVWYGWDR